MGQTNCEVLIKMILDRESLHLEYRYLCSLFSSMKQQSITSIGIPQKDRRLKILTTPTDIQEAIIQQNTKYFTTPEASLLGLGEFLHQAIGNQGTTKLCNQVLQGNLHKKDLSNIKLQETKELLQRMKVPE